jgi:hypothetical protein
VRSSGSLVVCVGNEWLMVGRAQKSRLLVEVVLAERKANAPLDFGILGFLDLIKLCVRNRC